MALTEKQKRRAAIILVLILATTAFIFWNSTLSRADSGGTSRSLYERLFPFFYAVFGRVPVTHDGFRKLAHFTEFGLLGLLYSLLTVVLQKEKPQHRLNIGFIGFFTAFCDETIQIFSARGPAIGDVWIDMAGFVCGMIAITLITGVVRLWRK